jgi:mRNA-degrading endonuclease RelE of RelBE toxin-antitoxin system
VERRLATRYQFIRSRKFQEHWSNLGLSDDEYKDLTTTLTEYFRNPPANNFGRPFPGNVIEGTGGAVKYRYAIEASNEGKSGSYRVIYLIIAKDAVYFIDVYGKHTQETLSRRDKNAIRKLSRELRQ